MIEPQVWQIACGETGRKYEDLFFDHNIMFLGPGRFGPFGESNYRWRAKKGQISNNRLGMIRRFAEEVQPGDIVLLRFGHNVISMGLVAEQEYFWSEIFDDVYGWDLQHVRRIIWQSQLDKNLKEIQKKGDLFKNRKQIPTFTKVADNTILEPIRHLFDQCIDKKLQDIMLRPQDLLSLEEFSELLFAKGLSYDAVHRVKTTIEKQQQLLKWYNKGLSPNRPSEHEIVAHIILPLMHALGWSEQLLAVEWHKIDLAVFWKTPTEKNNCKLICEAKAFGKGMQKVVEQAKNYYKKHKLDKCNKILVADGGRFYLYRKGSIKWEANPSGYMNLLKLRTDHLCPSGTSAVDTLIALTPSHVAQ
ncbi:MAG: hypothetical protein E3J72_05210 [Planctomycetota bacterium]|nr:MAG: hypothetical protein E3J72_05210 [Planctomycetota bacterium]